MCTSGSDRVTLTSSDSRLPTTGTVLATQQCIAGDAVANVL